MIHLVLGEDVSSNKFYPDMVTALNEYLEVSVGFKFFLTHILLSLIMDIGSHTYKDIFVKDSFIGSQETSSGLLTNIAFRNVYSLNCSQFFGSGAVSVISSFEIGWLKTNLQA